MKRLAVGALFVALLAGSVAMAGQGYRGPGADRGDSHSDRGGHDRGGNRNDHGRNDRGHRDRGDWNRGHEGGRGDWNRGHDRRDWNDRHRDDPRGWDHNGRRDWNDGRRFDHQPPRYYAPPRVYSPPRHYAPPRYYAPPRARYYWGAYHQPYGYYSHRWGRGERLPVAYYAPRYVVSDYDRCGLRAPPYGYHWVRVDSDVALAAIATGVILDVVYNQFY